MVSALASVKNLDNTLAQVGQDYRNAQISLEQTEQEIAGLEKNRLDKKKLLKKKYTDAGRFLMVLYRLKQNTPAHMITKIQTPEVTIHSMIALKRYIQTLQDRLVKISEELKNLEVATTEAEGKKQVLKEKLAEYESQQKKLEELVVQKKKEAAKKIKNRRALAYHANLAARGADTLQDLIGRVKKGGVLQKRTAGGAPMYTIKPVQGKMVAIFGQAHEHSPQGTGIVFLARDNEYVFAPLAGQIVYAGPFRRYKNIVIITHNDNYHTVLTGLDRIDVFIGQTVQEGMPLGSMGKEGSFLYLELRHKGQPIPPGDFA